MTTQRTAHKLHPAYHRPRVNEYSPATKVRRAQNLSLAQRKPVPITLAEPPWAEVPANTTKNRG